MTLLYGPLRLMCHISASAVADKCMVNVLRYVVTLHPETVGACAHSVTKKSHDCAVELLLLDRVLVYMYVVQRCQLPLLLLSSNMKCCQ